MQLHCKVDRKNCKSNVEIALLGKISLICDSTEIGRQVALKAVDVF
jgi:hypothetical protein